MSVPPGTADEVLKMSLQKWAVDNSLTIGNTPLVKLNRVTEGCVATVLAKIEGRNPAYSVKCRIGASMIWEAERSGELKPGMTVVEPTSGNTGIALAFVTAARGYKCLLVMPESMSIERRKVIKVLGAQLLLTDAHQGMKGAVSTAESIVELNPDKYFMPQQFRNPANPLIHELTTGPEIWDATDGEMDVLVCGVGTGGTITGITRYWRNVRKKPLWSVAVEPNTSPVLSQAKSGLPTRPGPHKIQGLGAGFVPEILDLEQVSEVETVTQEDACDMARQLAMQEGILCGISCGAAAAVAVRLARQPRFAGRTIVVVLPDSGERYLSTSLFDTAEFRYLETATASSGIL